MAHHNSSTRMLQSAGISSFSTPELSQQLYTVLGGLEKTKLKARAKKLPRNTANLAPDGTAKPIVAAPPPPPPPLQERPPPSTMEMLQDAGYEYNEAIGGYVFFVPVDYNDMVAQGKVAPLKDYRWIDERTQSVEVMFAVYNGNYQLFSIVQLGIQFELGGRVTKSVDCSTIDLELYSNPDSDYTRLILEIIFVAYLLFTLMGELQQVCADGLGEYFDDYYNALDLSAIVLMFVAMLFWLRIEIVAPGVEVPDRFDFSVDCPTSGCPNGIKGVPELFTLVTDLLETSQLYTNYRLINIVNIFLNLGRIFKYFGAQKRMALINNTFARAGPDLAHFIITFFTVFMGFSVTGWLIFGNLDRHWSTIFGGVFSDIPALGAFNMVYKMALGEIDMEEMYTVLGGSGWMGILYYYALTLLVIFIMVNVFLAIVMDSYAGAVEEAHAAKSLFYDIRVSIAHFRNVASGTALPGGVISDAITQAQEDAAGRKPDIITDGHADSALCRASPPRPVVRCLCCCLIVANLLGRAFRCVQTSGPWTSRQCAG
jgi:hypothetical protein